jgi:hypothetical protein
MASFMLSDFSYVLFPQLLSWGSADLPALLAEVTRVRETATAMEAARAAILLTSETSARGLLQCGIVPPSVLRMRRTGLL